jgi:hypothetical protein
VIGAFVSRITDYLAIIGVGTLVVGTGWAVAKIMSLKHRFSRR